MKRLFCLLLAAVLCALLLPVSGASAADTLEERQQAIIATALAYFDKGNPVQYDRTHIVPNIPRKDGGKARITPQEAPEYATKYETIYSVCADYPHQVLWDAFGYKLFGEAGACWTGKYLAVKEGHPMYVADWDKDSGKDVKEAITEMMALAQPGDILTRNSTDAHVLLYLGEMEDGKTCFIHSFGSSINMDTGADIREYKPDSPDIDPRYKTSVWKDNNNGGIRLSPNALEYALGKYGNEKSVRITLIRPLAAMPADEYPIRPAARYRMTHPRLCIDRVVEEHSRFHSLYPGEKITLSVTLSNSSKVDYTVPVTEKTPAGAKLVKPFEGAAVSGDTQTFDVELPAGEKKTLTAEYEITASRGETVTFAGGFVGDIPSNSIPLRVGGKKLNAEDEAKLSKITQGAYDDMLLGVKDEELGNTVYRTILGLDVALPTFDSVWKMTTEKTFSDGTTAHVLSEKSSAGSEDAFAMLVPTFHGGKELWNEWGHDCCRDPKDLHLEPGDVIVRVKYGAKRNTFDTLVCLGSGKYLKTGSKTNAKKIVEEPELVKSLIFDAFYCLRPTLAYDDIHAQAAKVQKMQFTDVQPRDWFYTYVRDLVADGTVSGMTATTFQPNGNLTYGQALKLIALAVGEKEPAKSGGHWASGYLALAKSKGWISEDVDPDGTITRLALCKIAAKAKGLKTKPVFNPFTDTSDPDVLVLYDAGVISGMSATAFKPDGLLTRAQIAKIICLLRKA